MKNLILTIAAVLVLGGAGSANAQDLFYVGTSTEYADTATVTWDSIAIGSTSLSKLFTVFNDDTVALYLAFVDDTSAGVDTVASDIGTPNQYLTIKAAESYRIDHLKGVGYVRVKAAANCLFRLRWINAR